MMSQKSKDTLDMSVMSDNKDGWSLFWRLTKGITPKHIGMDYIRTYSV